VDSLSVSVEYHRPEMVGQPVRLSPRPVMVAGREALLAEVDARLSADDYPPRIVVLCGLAGVGKTSVALEYAHRHLAEVGVCWQFAAEDPVVLAAGFGELAAQLGVRGVLDTRDPVASVHGVLAAYPAEWLLVFDNVPDLPSVEAFLPPTGRGRVVITSQNQLRPPGQALEVPVLDIEVAADFLVGRTGDPDRRAAVDLAGELGGLPLALEQAAAYMQVTGDSLVGYLESFRQLRVDILGRGEPTGYGKTVATTWTLAFGQLEKYAPDAISLLRLVAYCAPEAIPLRLLLQPGPRLGRLPPRMAVMRVALTLLPLLQDPLAAKDAIAALRQYSLISSAADGQVSVHRLVQAVTVDQMPAKLAGAWRRVAAAVIEAALPSDPGRPDAWPDLAALLPHTQAALTMDSGGMRRVTQYLGHSGNYVAARDLSRAVLEVRVRTHGPKRKQTLYARDDLARWSGYAGDPVAARDEYTALLPLYKQVFGPEHPDTLGVRASLARWTGEAGDPALARDEYTALLPLEERVLGPEQRGTLGARANLAFWTGNAGDPVAARDQYSALVPLCERVLGPEHPYTLGVRSNLARWTGYAGDPVAARDRHAALVPLCERVLGPEHPDTLTARESLAFWIGEAGDAAGACDEYAALLPVRQRVSGPEHPDTLGVRASLARWTGYASDPVAARDEFAALMPLYERVLGPEHPYTLTARANLAFWTGEAGDPVAARDVFATLLPIRERVSGPEHPDTLTARHNLAYLTGEAGDPAAARDQFAALVPIRERVLGAEHPETLKARNNLAFWAMTAVRRPGVD
jgi:Tetratricopeptide repeat